MYMEVQVEGEGDRGGRGGERRMILLIRVIEETFESGWVKLRCQMETMKVGWECNV